MSETNCATGDSTGAILAPASRRSRLMVLGVFVALVIALVAWIERNTWRAVNRLKQDFAAVNLGSFFLGVHLREAVLEMNGALFRFQLSEEPAEREAFQRERDDLAGWIARSKAHLATATERQLVQEIEMAYQRYLAESAVLLERGIRGIRRDTAAQLHQQIREKSAALVGLADRLVQAQRAALEEFRGGSHHSLGALQRVMVLSVALLLVLFALLVLLAHRTWVAPLRLQLNDSRAVIERQEKLASLGTLAAGVAHEIRNPLTAIKFRLFSLKNSLPPEHAEAEDLQVVGEEINRLERIVRDFLLFARPTEPELAVVSAQQLLQEVHRLLQPPLAKRGIRLELETGDACELRADRQQITQVLINLVQNAADSIEREGTVALRARAGRARINQAPEAVVMLEVSDTGTGIPPEVEERLFDPFFSTKEAGTGLGLPIAARIVEKHGGHVQYQTQRHRGTTFSVVLPRHSTDAGENPHH